MQTIHISSPLTHTIMTHGYSCMLLAFLNSITKHRITPTNSNDVRNDVVLINLSLLQ
jgi:hypothetical protein